MAEPTLQDLVYRTAMDLCAAGLIRLSAGNLSARDAHGHVAITPAALPYSKMTAEDVVIIDLDGRVVDGLREPSSETAMHTAVYRALPGIGAIVHTHSVYAIALAAVGLEIPVVCLEVLAAGGPIPVLPYACPGTAEAAAAACDGLASRPGLKAVLLRNHGLLAVGGDLGEAFQHALNCETGAQVYHLALQTGRRPRALTEAQIAEIARRYPAH